jgi:hypothetical protein
MSLTPRIDGIDTKNAEQDAKAVKNLIINGGMDFWQRGTNFSGTKYTADRWFNYNMTISRQSLGNPQDGQVSLTEQESGYFLRSINTGANELEIFLQRIEGVHTLAGKKGILSFDIKGSIAGTINNRCFAIFGSGGSPSFSFGWKQVPVTTEWNRVYVEIDFPSVTGKTIGSGSNITICFDINVSGASEATLYTDLSAPISAPSYVGTIDVKNVMLHEDTGQDIDVPFQRAGRNYAEELQLCERYYQKIFSQGYQYFFGGTAYCAENLRVPMRTTPMLDYTVDFSTNFNITSTFVNETLFQFNNVPTTSSAYTRWRLSINLDAEL